MSVVLLAVGVTMLGLAPLPHPVGRAVSPDTWARRCLHAIWLGMVTAAGGLAHDSDSHRAAHARRAGANGGA